MNELKELLAGGELRAGQSLEAVRTYCTAKPPDLEAALEIQQSRGIALDEKTFKHAASIATALTVASAATTAVAQLLSNHTWKLVVIAFTFPGVMYVMIGGLLGIAAARTLPTFGSGILFKIERDNEKPEIKPYALAMALACQEKINLIRVARNEAAFMCIRNGFLFTMIAISTLLLGVHFATKVEAIERKIWPAFLQGI